MGAPNTGGGNGAAYFFTRSGSTWTYSTAVYPAAANDGGTTQFGSSVAISGAYAMVSAVLGGTPQIYVYEQVGSGWFAQPVITLPFQDAGYLDPPTVALEGTTALIGSTTGTSSPTVYVLSTADGGVAAWTPQGTLTPTESIPNLYLLWEVGLSGDTAVVGVSAMNVSGSEARWADVFVRKSGTWAEQATLAPPGIQASNAPHFSFSVGIDEDTAILAASPGGFVYNRTGASSTQQPSKQEAGVNILPVPYDQAFGAATAVTPGAVLVGDTFGYSGGMAFLFGLSKGVWHEYELPTFDAGGPLTLGAAVARSGSTSVVGATGGTESVPEGAVLVYSCSP